MCECCGEPAEHVHHKDLNWLNNTPENLIACCVKCHNEIHSNLEKKFEGCDKLDRYNKSFLEFIRPILRLKD